MEDRLAVAVESALASLREAMQLRPDDERAVEHIDDARFELERALHEYERFGGKGHRA